MDNNSLLLETWKKPHPSLCTVQSSIRCIAPHLLIRGSVDTDPSVDYVTVTLVLYTNKNV